LDQDINKVKEEGFEAVTLIHQMIDSLR